MNSGAALLLLVVTAGLALASIASRAEADDKHAQFNYQLFCQGCHGPSGDGGRGVPMIREQIGLFLNSQQGREYLIRVPGAANSPLDDAQLAKLMNWTIETFGGASVPQQWQAYTGKEVGNYRKKPLLEVMRYRQELLSTLSATTNR
ncbi:MAG: c-type cytochrome [Pseudomonadales bacterium]